MRTWINLLENALPKEFWDWFGDSKITDEKGDPLVVYHGGTRWRVAPSITWFTDSPHVADGYADQGFEDSEIKACYLRIENPLDLRRKDHLEMVFPDGLGRFVHNAYADYVTRNPEFALKTSREAISMAIDYAQHHGFDGLIHPDSNVENHGQHTSYVIFSPSQVKAARFKGWENESIYGNHYRSPPNKGSYSRDNEDLTEDIETDADGYFKNPLKVDVETWAAFHTPRKARDAEPLFKKRREVAKNITLQELPISDLVAIESHLYPNILKNPSKEPPYVELINGVYYIADGNHRVVSEYLKGKDTIVARVANYDIGE